MTKTQAHAILDRIKRKDRKFVSLAQTNQALERTGDIAKPFGEPLCADGHEQGNNRSCQAYDAQISARFSWSKYLDCSTTESVK